ncbi:DHHW family protein [Cohnella soli]|uniref:DHHW family protein n=1 Tax=Cohnella soli TaxID=425005 RepID=A0ABW0I003_9BACL
MSKSVSIVYIVVFAAIIFGFAIASAISPDKDISITENRTLSRLPAVNLEAVASRQFFEKMNQYFNDQIALRNEMVNLYQGQMNSRLLNPDLLHSRVVSNLVVVDNKWILPMTDKVVHKNRIDESTAKLIAAVKYAEGQGTETHFIFNPSRTKSLMHLYPAHLQTDAYAQSKAYFLSKLANNVDVLNIGNKFDTFTDAELEQLYLETDHHWNIKGAFAAYQEMISQLSDKSPQFEGKPLTLSDIRVTALSSGRFEGSYNVQMNFAINPKTADRTMIYEPKLPFAFQNFEVIGKDGSQTVKSFDDFYGFKSERRTYAYGTIYGGDQRKIVYDNPKASNSLNVLLLKDSFMNPLTPYLAQHFRKLTVYDNRYYSEFSLKKILASEHYDMLLIAFHDDNLFSGTYEFEKKGEGL